MVNDNANFTPSFKGYTGQEPFRFWCQTVLPLVYDDSLSYYELLNKVVVYLNNVISDVGNMETNVDRLLTAYTQLQNYVNEYFNNLDVQQEIDNKLDEMATDGTLIELVNPYIIKYATPYVVNSVGDMIDTKRTYVLESNGHIYQYRNNLWTDTGLSYTGELDGYLGVKSIPAGLTDLNDLDTIGIYYHSTNQTILPDNSPFQSNTAFMIVVYSGGSRTRLYQKIVSYSDNKVYIRGSVNNNTWNAWKSLATNREVETNIETKFNTYKTTDINTKNIPESAISVDDIIVPGVYYVTQTNALLNKPSNNGVLVVYTDTSSLTARSYQTWISYSDSSVYVRNRINSQEWRSWKQLANIDDAFNYTNIGDQTDISTLNTFSAYFVSDGAGLPEGSAGLVMNIKQPNWGTRAYQIYLPYATNNMYFRHMQGGVFREWKKVATSDDIERLSNKGRIEKIDSTTYNIRFGGYIAKLERIDDDNKNAHLWNITQIKKENNTIVPVGTDIIGPIKEANEADFMGGVHGDEINTAFAIYADGVPYDMESTVSFERLDICMISNMQRVSTKANIFTRTVNICISGNAITISNQYKALVDNITVNRATNGGLIAVRNNILNGIYMNNYFANSAPTEPISNSSSENTIGKLFTTLGTITVENIVGNEKNTYTGQWYVFTNESPIRTKLYFDVISSNTTVNNGDLITGVFKYTFD